MEELIDKLLKKKVEVKSYDGGTHKTDLVHREGKNIFEAIIREYLLDNRDSELATLKAKVFMYEEIIKKSNFAPMIENKIPEVPIDQTQEA